MRCPARWLRHGSFVALALCFPAVLRADTEAQRHTLTGLQSVHLQFTLRGEDLQTLGLDEVTLRPQIEARLAAAGLTLVDAEASRRVPGVPWLFLDVGAMKTDDTRGYAWLLRLYLQQRAALERDTAIVESVSTWEGQRFGSVGRRKVKTLHEDVLGLVDQFVTAWQAANPRH